MNLYSQIFTRKSTRQFDMTPLDANTLKDLEAFITKVTPLLPNSKLTYKILGKDEVKGLALPKAPHYMIISGEPQPLRDVCAGFLFQHVVLYLYAKGYAVNWISTLKSKEKDKNHIVGFAFGKPKDSDSAHRSSNEFERKSMQEIVKGNDSRMEAVRLAPSGMNKQPWYFIVDGTKIHVYYQKSLGGLLGMYYKLTGIDIGLALCHLAVASDHEGKPFKFHILKINIPTPPKDFTYIGTVE